MFNMYYVIGAIMGVIGIFTFAYIWINALIKWSAGYVKDAENNYIEMHVPKWFPGADGRDGMPEMLLATTLGAVICVLNVFIWFPVIVILLYIGVLRLLRHLFRINKKLSKLESDIKQRER